MNFAPVLSLGFAEISPVKHDSLIQHIKRPSEQVQIEAVRQNNKSIRQIFDILNGAAGWRMRRRIRRSISRFSRSRLQISCSSVISENFMRITSPAQYAPRGLIADGAR
jgi:hypothetical protein